jgi:PhzF family phenazine biosynthesis protein
MQQIAMENNLAETAFFVPEGEDHRIRWFTPAVEVDLCGHATLAAAHVLYTCLQYTKPQINFQSRSGLLVVTRDSSGKLTLDFPIDEPVSCPQPPIEIFEGLGIQPVPVARGEFDYLVELENEAAIAALQPDFRILGRIESRGVIVTAKGDHADFVSRCFFPQSGIDEDPVTGSAHCLLSAWWKQRTGRNNFQAIQLSARKGYLECTVRENRVLLKGQAVLFLKGEIFI